MANLFFYANVNVEDLSSGILKKVKSQIETLRKMGFSVVYSCYTNDGVAIFDNNDNIIESKKIPNKINYKYLRRWYLLKFANQYIIKCNSNFTYSYLRYHFFDHAYFRLLKNLKNKKNSINIVEAHGYPAKGSYFSSKFFIYIIDSIYEKFVNKYIDFVAAISNYNNIWGCKTIHIDNSVDLKKIKLQEKIKSDDTIKLICVSIERKYHGYKKLIKGLKKYYDENGQRNIEIDFVGVYSKKTKNLVKKLNLDDKIHFLGKKYGDELIKLYNNADLGVGAFGFRGGTEYGSSIKTKEYFALGIPFINGWKEYSFDDSYPYVKRFDLNCDYIDFNEVVKFYESIKDDDQMKYKMRKFAEDHFTWEAQFTKIFNEINKS